MFRLVLQDSGTAIMGQAEAEGENRAVEAVKKRPRFSIIK